MHTKTCLLLLSLLCLLSCNDSVSPSNQICAQIKGENLIITNKSNTTLYYAAFERNSLATLDWGPFCNDDTRVTSQHSKTQKLSSIYSYQANDTIVVYWWECKDSKAIVTDNPKYMAIPTAKQLTICQAAR